MEHTLEPWYIPYDTVLIRQFDAEDSPLIADTAGTTNAEANARRIVACVNACTGILTETLEGVASEGISLHAYWRRGV